jgi:hypothetical protein
MRLLEEGVMSDFTSESRVESKCIRSNRQVRFEKGLCRVLEVESCALGERVVDTSPEGLSHTMGYLKERKVLAKK